MPVGLCSKVADLLEYPVAERRTKENYIGFSSLVWS